MPNNLLTAMPNNPPAITAENYFSPENNLRYMGSSQYKSFLSCEARALAEIRGEYVRPASTALLVGSYVDARFSGELELFTAQHPEIFKRDGGLKSDYVQANDIIARIERDELFTQALSGEKQRIMTGEIEGVPFKIKIDSMLPDRTVDLKVMRDMDDVYSADEGVRVPFWQAWGYDVQGAIYQEIRRQNDNGEIKPFGLAVATKQAEPDIALLEFSQGVLDVALDEVKFNAVHFDAVKKDLIMPEWCGTCDYCRRERKIKHWRIIL